MYKKPVLQTSVALQHLLMHFTFKAQTVFSYCRCSVPLQGASKAWEPKETPMFVPVWCWTGRVESTPAKEPSAALGSPFLSFLTPLACPGCLGPSATNKSQRHIPDTKAAPPLPDSESSLRTGVGPRVLHRDHNTEGHCCLWFKCQPWEVPALWVKDLCTQTRRYPNEPPCSIIRIALPWHAGIFQNCRGKSDPVA